MGTGWRRAFCTSIRRDPEIERTPPQPQQQQSPGPSPRSCGKLGFFSGAGTGAGGSNPSTPRPQSQGAVPGLRCRTKSTPPGSPRVQQYKAAVPLTSSRTPPPSSTSSTRKRSPVLSLFKGASNPSSPRSPSRFAFLKATLHLSRSRCGICAGSVKAGGGTAVFTAECSHAFHFPCIAAHVRSHGSLTCPVCSAAWRRAPLLSAIHQRQPAAQAGEKVGEPVAVESRKKAQSVSSSMRNDKGTGKDAEDRTATSPAATKIYDDDEPLLPSKTSPRSGVLFNPIPEADEDMADDDGDEAEDGGDGMEVDEEFHGFSVGPPPCKRNHEFKVMPEAVALVSSGRRHGSYVVKLKVRAPPLWPAMAPLLDPGRRAPIDLVTVLDVSGGMTATKLHMLKRAMRLVISSLGPGDRLSVVAFSSSAAKRLLPLRRMSRQGQRSARQIVERLVVCGGSTGCGGAFVGDALRKATKVLEDRRERNPVATIMLLSDGQQQQQQQQVEADAMKKGDHSVKYSTAAGDRRLRQQQYPSSASTRFAHLEIPIHASCFGEAQQQKQGGHCGPMEDAFAKCVGGLVSVVMQDVHVQFVVPSAGEISAVYSGGGGGAGGWAVALGGGGGSCSVRLGDLYAEEERELLLELRVPHHAILPQSLSVRWSFRDPATRELVCGGEQPLLLPPLPSPSQSQSQSQGNSKTHRDLHSIRLRNLFVTTRAVAESRRLADLTDFATALHLLSSARSLLLQSPLAASDQEDLVRSLEAEIADLQRRRAQGPQQQQQQQQHSPSPLPRRQREAEGRGEPLTPTSAWRAAEQLAKVAIMRKSLNRVSDLHGFENARF